MDVIGKNTETAESFILSGYICCKLRDYKHALTYLGTGVEIQQSVLGSESEDLKETNSFIHHIKRKMK